ncbi:MAG TPA: hypothetical protein VMT76_11760 [Puia sp.]|nr:hypothetical protein [Puia sp.]
MKKQLLITIAFALCIADLSAQHSCDAAYRFDAGYTRTLDQLENVNITLQTSKPAKNPSDRSGKSEIIQSYYAAPGAASAKQFLSADANIGFTRCYVLQPNLELYKAEVKNGMRTFTIPAGSNGSHSVNIPIQVITPPGMVSNGVVNWGPGNFKVKFSGGYLQSGEYILIDKNSMSSNGTQMKGYAFSIQ